MILTWLVPQTASQYALFLLQGSLRDGPGRWCQILEQPRHREQVTCARVQNRGSREEEVRIALMDRQEADFVTNACRLLIHPRLRASKGPARELCPDTRRYDGWVGARATLCVTLHRSTPCTTGCPGTDSPASDRKGKR